MNKDILGKLIKYNTISANSNMKLIDFCAQIFTSFSYEITKTVFNNKANLFAYKKCIGPRLVLSAHTDTVPTNNNWETNPFDLIENNGKLYGLGICDMKVFIAIMLDLAKNQKEDRLAFLLTFDEETDLSGARLVNNEIIRPIDYVLIGEPTNIKVIIGNKGLLAYKMTIKGVAGHSSNPENGISAIDKAILFLSKLKDRFLNLDKTKNNYFSLPDASMNIGTIRGAQQAT